MPNNERLDEKEFVVKVKPGTKVRLIETTTNDPDLSTRDLHMTAPQSMKIAVKRVASSEFEGSPSTFTMCG